MALLRLATLSVVAPARVWPAWSRARGDGSAPSAASLLLAVAAASIVCSSIGLGLRAALHADRGRAVGAAAFSFAAVFSGFIGVVGAALVTARRASASGSATATTEAVLIAVAPVAGAGLLGVFGRVDVLALAIVVGFVLAARSLSRWAPAALGARAPGLASLTAPLLGRSAVALGGAGVVLAIHAAAFGAAPSLSLSPLPFLFS